MHRVVVMGEIRNNASRAAFFWFGLAIFNNMSGDSGSRERKMYLLTIQRGDRHCVCSLARIRVFLRNFMIEILLCIRSSSESATLS
ncbi:hypothetical protein BLAT2472_40470 [Burkholderia latens]